MLGVGSPTTPAPVPGSSRTLRYTFATPAQIAFVRDLKSYGSFVHLVADPPPGGDPLSLVGAIGCVVDVKIASVSEDGRSAAVVARCRDEDARVQIGRVLKEFPYAACECSLLPDHASDADVANDDFTDPLAAYEFLEADESSQDEHLDAARDRCYQALDSALALAESLDPALGACDELGAERPCGEFAAMRARLAGKLARLRDYYGDDDDESLERAERALGCAMLAACGPTRELSKHCVATLHPARRYAAIERHVKPLRSELAALVTLRSARASPAARYAPRDAPMQLAMLREGRAITYWWSDSVGWATATVLETADEDGNTFVEFADGTGKLLPLATADRDRWKLLAL